MDEAWLNTVRLARDCGDISSLFPEGITRLYDLPHTIHTAIRVALQCLGWEEIIQDANEMPPRHIWLDGAKLTQWWKEVREAREERMKEGVATRDMPQNDLIKEMFPGVNVG